MGSSYVYLENDFLDDPDYDTAPKKLIAIHLFSSMDFAGVAPWKLKTVASKTAFCDRTIRDTRDELQETGKLVVSNNGRWVWLKSGIFYRLNKGRYSRQQMSAVVDKLSKWGSKPEFDLGCINRIRNMYGKDPADPGKSNGNDPTYFPATIAELYAIKYGLIIPYSTIPFHTVLLKEISQIESLKNVDNLSTAGKRIVVRLSLTRFGPLLDDCASMDWIDDLVEQYGADRALAAATWIQKNQDSNIMSLGVTFQQVVEQVIKTRKGRFGNG